VGPNADQQKILNLSSKYNQMKKLFHLKVKLIIQTKFGKPNIPIIKNALFKSMSNYFIPHGKI
jgi:hypothetical protein